MTAPPLRPLTAHLAGPGPHPVTLSASTQPDGAVTLAIHLPAAHPHRARLLSLILATLTATPDTLELP